MAGLTPKMNVRFRVFNPSQLPIVINSIAGKVFMANNEVGSIEFAQKTVVNGQNTGFINVPVFFTTGILPLLFSAIKGQSPKPQFKIVGTVLTKAASINFNDTITLN
jgi:LEA14-like dessication related protein